MIGISSRLDDVVAFYRALEASDRPRACFEFVDAEGWVDEGARALYETVEYDGELITIRQIELPSAGGMHRYSWRVMEDAYGCLTDEPLDPHDDPIKPIPREMFEAIWNAVPEQA
ncbi:hypothetical protein AB0K14_22655 [Actinosynnema sp. NPDC050801]|jgi:hypothetical protein|uniref:hypothetical protein n=1 Tax=unclassified Actinosynnema TaxID=2637065 RepID=UPI0033E4A93D